MCRLAFADRGARVAPFAAGGAGYLRSCTRTATLVQTGRYYQFGGGVTCCWRRAPTRRHAIGVRVGRARDRPR